MLKKILVVASLLAGTAAFATATTTTFNDIGLSGKPEQGTANHAMNAPKPELETNGMMLTGVAIMGLIAFRRLKNS